MKFYFHILSLIYISNNQFHFRYFVCYKNMTLQRIEIKGKSIALNNYGYLKNYQQWDEELAKILAQDEGIELNPCHWQAIYFIRNYYKKYEVPPTQKTMFREIGHKFKSLKCTRKMLEDFFPEGCCEVACRVSGLPDFYY